MTYRTGNHQPQNLYRGDAYIGVMFDPADTALIVDALEGEQAPDLSDLALRLAATKVRAARPGVEPQTALAVVQAMVAMGWRPPSARASLPVSAEPARAEGSGYPRGAEAISGGCDCGREGLPARLHFRPCPIAELHYAPRCICNDPPPTVDKPKNGTATRPPGWSCPRHGMVI